MSRFRFILNQFFISMIMGAMFAWCLLQNSADTQNQVDPDANDSGTVESTSEANKIEEPQRLLPEAITLPSPPAFKASEQMRSQKRTEQNTDLHAQRRSQNESETDVSRSAAIQTSKQEYTQPPIDVADNSPSSEPLASQLLRLRERGEGPEINVLWPEEARKRELLFNFLNRCAGMRVARLVGDTIHARPKLKSMEGYSKIIRIPSGHISERENSILNKISLPGIHVRVYKRQMDESLISGLLSLLGKDYLYSKIIRARYELVGKQLWLNNIVLDDRTVPGKILITTGSPTSTKCINE